jgi:hypothetical protein
VSSESRILGIVLKFDRGGISSRQSDRVFLGVNRWEGGSGCQETVAFVSRKLSDILHGRQVEISPPPPLQVLCSHVAKVRAFDGLLDSVVMTRILRTVAPGRSRMLQPDSSYIADDEMLSLIP